METIKLMMGFSALTNEDSKEGIQNSDSLWGVEEESRGGNRWCRRLVPSCYSETLKEADMGWLHDIIGSISVGLNIIGAIITIWGILLSLFEFLKKEILHTNEAVKLNESIRIKLGSYLVLALEFFIAGDIVKTIVTPTWESLGVLGAIVIIRTILSHFLTKDLNKLKEA